RDKCVIPACPCAGRLSGGLCFLCMRGDFAIFFCCCGFSLCCFFTFCCGGFLCGLACLLRFRFCCGCDWACSYRSFSTKRTWGCCGSLALKSRNPSNAARSILAIKRNKR